MNLEWYDWAGIGLSLTIFLGIFGYAVVGLVLVDDRIPVWWMNVWWRYWAKRREPFAHLLQTALLPSVSIHRELKRSDPDALKGVGYAAGEYVRWPEHHINMDREYHSNRYPTTVFLHEIAHARAPFYMGHGPGFIRRHQVLLDQYHPGLRAEEILVAEDRPCERSTCEHSKG